VLIPARRNSAVRHYPASRTASPKTPPAIAAKLSQAFAEILREPEVEKKWREMALTPVGGTPDEVGTFLKPETARWRHVIASGGIKRQ
jgi:tripartite-type tricarboxylate transporter receptor subunit TctC